jgi:hypothetical protein
MPSTGFELAIPAIEQPQKNTLGRKATGIVYKSRDLTKIRIQVKEAKFNRKMRSFAFLLRVDAAVTYYTHLRGRETLCVAVMITDHITAEFNCDRKFYVIFTVHFHILFCKPTKCTFKTLQSRSHSTGYKTFNRQEHIARQHAEQSSSTQM